jgi:hypothetical protein
MPTASALLNEQETLAPYSVVTLVGRSLWMSGSTKAWFHKPWYARAVMFWLSTTTGAGGSGLSGVGDGCPRGLEREAHLLGVSHATLAPSRAKNVLFSRPSEVTRSVALCGPFGREWVEYRKPEWFDTSAPPETCTPSIRTA